MWGCNKNFVQMYEEDKSHQFLRGLNDEFSNIRSQILAQELLPQFDKILNMVMQEENHKHMMVQRESKFETTSAFAVNTSKLG